MGTLANKTINGIKWSTTATIVNLVLQVGYTAVMARLLDPVEFGLMAMANVFMRFGGYFANMGMSQALIQKPELTQKDIRAAFTTSVVLGVLFLGIIYTAAPLAARLYNSVDVVPIIKVLSVNFLFGSLSTTSSSLIRRQLRFQQYSIILIVVFAVQSSVGIILAYMGYGVWSLVYTGILNSILFAILTYAIARHSIKLYLNWKVYKPLLAFGSKISAISFMEFLSLSADTMFIGRYLGAVLLGIYNRANLIVQLPLFQLNTSISRVLFPAFSSIQKDTNKLRKIYLSSSSIIAFLFMSICAGAAVASENIVYVVLGEDWKEAIPILKILAILVPFKLLSHYGGIICDSTARLNIKMAFESIYILVLVTIFYMIRNTTLIHFSIALFALEVVKFSAYSVIMKNVLKFDSVTLFKTYAPSFVSGFLVAGAIYLTHLIIEPFVDNYLIRLIIDIITGGIVLFFILFLKINKPVMEELNLRLFGQYKFLDRIFNYIASPKK